MTTILSDFAKRGLVAEQKIREKIVAAEDDEQMLVGFLLGFASRPPSRERLNAFTTNYDRLIEFGCDRGGLRVLDRFVGSIEPAFAGVLAFFGRGLFAHDGESILEG